MTPKPNLACFYHGSINVSLLNPNICTHILYTSIGIDKDGNLTFPYVDEIQVLSELNILEKMRKINENLRLVISVGDSCDTQRKAFNLMLSSQLSRRNFAKNILGFCRRCNFDGIDINWQHPQVTLSSGFSDLLKKLKEIMSGVFAFDVSLPTEFDVFSFEETVDPQLLSVTVNATAFNSYDIKQIVKKVKMINLICFDMDQPSRELIDVDQAIDIWMSCGCPAGKLNIGIATYGRNDVRSAKLRASQVKVNGTGGIAVHAFDGDDSSHGFPLVRSIHEILDSDN